VREHVRCDSTAVVRQVEQAVALFARATRVSIEIAPEDEAAVREALPNLCAALPPEAEVSLRPRAGITRGGCFIRSSEGTIDARMETLFRRTREGIVGTAAPVAEPASDPLATVASAASMQSAESAQPSASAPDAGATSETAAAPETTEAPETPDAPDAPAGDEPGATT
ncbi:MAG: Flagellar assembly protein FliH, partial [Planctomycetota bacterium]